jgi:hypothetical protein
MHYSTMLICSPFVFDSGVHGRVFGVGFGGRVTEGRDVGVFVEGRSASMHANSVVVQEILQVIIIPASLSSRHLDSLFLLLLFRHSAQNVLELSAIA